MGILPGQQSSLFATVAGNEDKNKLIESSPINLRPENRLDECGGSDDYDFIFG
jgi:hypothetical protein